MTKIEEVARAMWEQRRKRALEDIPHFLLEEWGDGSIPRSNGVMEEARAAIAAMREPTPEMLTDEEVHWGYRCQTCGGLTEGWHKLIDAALKETP